ncbi:beta-mannosidase [Paenibacillus algorifonticola]|uniref:Beta-mannosidase B n=1 Tax=Paenibacillus algorifonticola TaxID=684063 RepID=A0A1I2G4K3_9BACL|nr:glycoside hydrolase family 2 protein [Paenibacillus algorifonticola]SFF12049.1 beta-mannosidase [Paenibacillus algorifonticola]
MKITDFRLQHFEVGEKPPLQLAAPGLDDRFWMTAKVPGDVHSTLIERRIIEHPYFGHNDIKCRWIEQKEWWYRAQFDYEVHEGQGERHELIFEGLDTFATIFVNGLEIGTAENMHRIYAFDVTKVVRPGKNAIAVRFDPLHLHHQDKEQFQWSSYTKERPWLRKAAMNFGWDWGPRMVTVGIWGGVRLERRRAAKLGSVFVQTLSAGKEEAALKVAVDTVAYHKQAQLTAEIKLFTREGEVVASAGLSVKGGREASAELAVKQPQLWWSHDLGEPYLYELEVELFADGEQVDSYRKPCGIRTIELQLEDEAGNPAFAFLLNGVKLFAKGSNWIPADSFIGAVKDKRYTDLIELAVDSNMNMLRIWAGGIYEKDIFYEECDRLGVLVWQDFAFANALFPDFNRNFMENVKQEAIDNVKRLRNHPSLALWCGNNEIDWLYDMKSAGGDITCPFYGESIYHELLPEVLEQYDSSRPYWPSSPYGGNDANDPDVGDRHNWQVWHGSVYPRKFGEAPLLDYSIEGVTFKNYKKDFTLFSSEFGMHASANRYTLERFIPEGEFYWGSVEMAHRNKDTNHQKGILLMEGYTGIPQNIEEYMNFSMLTQAEGLKYGIEHYRRNKHRTSGSLVWQHNDSWPGTSWSLIDYELLPKASFYYAKKFYHPLLLSLDYEPGQPLRVWAVNDRLEAYEGEVLFQCYALDGSLLYEQSFDVSLPPNTAVQIGELTEAEVLSGAAPEQVIVKLSAPQWDAPDNYYYLRDHLELSLPESTLAATFNEKEQSVTVAASGAAARLVKIAVLQGNVRFSDNYFDLLPGESVTVTLQQADGQPLRSKTLEVSALNAGKAELHFN